MPSSTCIVSADGANTNTCQQGGAASASLSLPPLPSIIRHNEDTYFEQRLNLPPLEHPLIQKSSSPSLDDSANASEKKLPKKWSKKPSSSFQQPQCRLYMAESSIPNSGLGIYAGVDIPPNTYIDPNPQIVLPLIDIDDHTTKKSGSESYYDESILMNYPWNSYTQGIHFESKLSSLLYPNLGMLANSHMGLVNAEQNGSTRNGDTVYYTKVLDRSVNPGTGSSSIYGGMTFKTNHIEGIKAGEEVFVDYGPSYFHHREKVWNTLFPSKEDYKTADDIVQEFLDGDVEEEWEEILALLVKGKYDLPVDEDEDDEDDEEENESIAEKKKRQQRIAHALPKSTDDLELVSDIGTARYSVPDSSVSMEHLTAHGFCLDNLRRGKSSIPQAGYGAFATKNLGAESIIAPAPLVPIKRDLLYMLFDIHDEEDSDNTVKDEKTTFEAEQLLLNYCFGHPQSSLLFFPYSSSVQYINHNNVNPNAYIRWSDSDLSRKKMLEKEVDDVYTGIILEVVALRDIEVGEEITIDYGPDWTIAWSDHLQSWNIWDDDNYNDSDVDVKSPQSYIDAIMNDDKHKNDPVRTMEEQKENPYPVCVRTACFSKKSSGTWKSSTFIGEYMRFCNIIDRIYNKGNYWYTVKTFQIEDEDDFDPEANEVELIPHEAVFFVPDEYCGDIHLLHSFRQEIGVPAGLYPDLWLDLKDDQVDSTLESDKDLNQKNDDETTTITCHTTAGQLSMVFRKSWSAIGYDRVVELFERGFYDDSHFFRVIPDFLTQFGISYTDDEDLKTFANTPIDDDPQLNPKVPFVEGTISFAGSGPNSRTSHLFISDTSTNKHFGTMLWETPVGSLVSNDDLIVLKKLNSDYGDSPPWGNGPEQHKIIALGKDYIEREFPKLDKILRCEIILSPKAV